jgi:cytoskeletal protein RodZ
MPRTSDDTAAILTRKIGPLPVWVWAAAGVVGVLLWQRHQAATSGGTSTASTSTDATTGYSAAAQQEAAALAASDGSAYPIGYSDYSSTSDLAGVLSNLSSQVATLVAGNSGTTTTKATSPGSTQTGASNQTAPAKAAAALPKNPYSVGMTVAKGETIVESLYQPATKQWLNLTNLGGIYTSGGVGLTGSAYGRGQTFGASGLSLGPGGQFIETSTAGKKFAFTAK